MKYVLLTPVLFLVFCKSKAQPDTNSLAKYSYILGCTDVNGDIIRQKGNGTGFFIKEDNRVYLITNYHVLSGYDSEADSTMLTFTHLFFRLPKNNNGDLQDMLVDSMRDSIIEKKIKNNECADLVALDVSSFISNKKINELSDFIDTSYFTQMPDSIIFYGYPSRIQTKESFLAKNPIIDKRDGAYKVVTPIIKTKSDEIFFDMFYKFHTPLKDILAEQGMSGSPVFGIYKEQDGDKIKFIGVIKGQPRGLNGAYLINAIEILKAIKTPLKLSL